MTLKYDSNFSHCRNRFTFIHCRNKLFTNNTQQIVNKTAKMKQKLSFVLALKSVKKEYK